MELLRDLGLLALESETKCSKFSSSGAVDFEKESDFVDEVILGVGTPEDLLKLSFANFSEEDWVSIEKQKLRKNTLLLLTEEERVNFCQKYFTEISIAPEILDRYQKNSETSRLLRNHGNDLFKAKNLEIALHYYNLALVFAETNSEAAGMAYANRSAVLIELGHFEDAWQDAELAMVNKYPKELTHKLEQRKNKCQQWILKKQQKYDAIELKQRKVIEAEIQEVKKMRNEMLRVKKPNPLIPAAAESVEIKFDENQGRHLVVNRDVPTGTVLIAESPYVFTLEHHSKWNLGHCHHCLKRIQRGTPCPNCVFAIYCNSSCQAEDEIHVFECKCLPYFHAGAFADQVLGAVRIIFKVGPHELFRLFKSQDPSFFNPKQPYGTEPDCKYESQSYLSVFHLATNAEKLPLGKTVGAGYRTLMTTEIIDRQTTFFEDIPTDMKKDFKKFVAGLMLRHIEAVNLNATCLLDFEGREGVSVVDSYISPEKLKDLTAPKFGQYGEAVYSVFSLLNHSCDPNVHYVNHTRNGTMVVMATRSLKKGEKLFTCYSTGFAFDDISNRQTELQETYQFRCCCIACEQKWPTSSAFEGEIPTFTCPICSKTFYEYDKGTEEFRKCVLKSPGRKCGSCGKQYTESELLLFGRTNVELTLEIDQLLRLNRPWKAFSKCVKVVERLQRHLCPPNVTLYFAQENLSMVLAWIFYLAE